MPHINLYVRDSDFKAYEAIEDKPDWLHRAIQNVANSHPVIAILDEPLHHIPLIDDEAGYDNDASD